MFCPISMRFRKQVAEEFERLVARQPDGLHLAFIQRTKVTCQRRVRKLYLPPGAKYFGCRTCYKLTYQSVQEHDKRVDYLLKNPEALVQALKSPPNWRVALLGLKAAFKLHGYL